MDVPSSSNVTGRRKRVAAADEMADDSFEGATPMRKVRGNKKIAEQDVASNDLMRTVTNAADEIITKKVGSRICFEYKSPLELFSIEKMIEANASIQEMAIVLDSAQYLFACRVDRLLDDVRNVDSALSGGDLSRTHRGDDDVRIPIENRKAKKKMAVADGISGVCDLLEKIGAEELRKELMDENGRFKEKPDEVVEEEELSAVVPDFRDAEIFMDQGDAENLINDLVINRSANFRSLLSSDHSSFVPADETAHDIKDSSIDFLRTNPTFQKATKGALDNKANSFHSLNYYGIHTKNGRALVLHPRIEEEKPAGMFFPDDVSESLAKNTRMLLHNSLQRKPHILDNYLMLEVKDRPVIGKYMEVKKDAPKKILPLAEADREKDLINQPFAEPVQPANPNVTVAGGSDISMLPGNAGLPLTADETRASPGLDQTMSAPKSRANDEYVPPSIDKLNLEVALHGKLPYDPLDMDKLTRIFDEKLETANSSDAIDSKVWKNGMRAEEWGEDDDTAMKGETRNAIQAGIEGWIKATDSWTNYDVVKMIVNREARMQLDQTDVDEQESHRNLVPEVGKNFFLVRSDEFMNNYPKDASERVLIGDETDVMKMWSAEEDNDAPLEEIQNILRVQNEQPGVANDNMEDDDYQGGGNFEMDYDNNLAADFDDMEPAAARRNNDNDILFDDRLAEGEEPAHHVPINIPTIATGEAEIPELTCHRNLNEKIEPTAEMRDEIRNAGRLERAHWHGDKHPDEGKQAALTAQRKRREKKAKTRKVTAEDFVQYFREVPEDEVEKEVSSAKMKNDDKGTYLTEQQLYLTTLGLESKPHIAFEMGILSNSGLFYKKSYGKVRLERVKNHKEEQEIIVDEGKSNRDSDCLTWLATFSGFRCMEKNPVTVATSTDGHSEHGHTPDNYVDVMDFDFAPRYEHDAAVHMRPDLKEKYVEVEKNVHNMFLNVHKDDDTLDEFDDSYDRQTIQAKNLDAAKHKKCIAEILKSEYLSMPSIQFALEQLSINTTRADNTTMRGGPSTSNQDTTNVSPQRSFEADKTLTSVFEYKAPTNQQHNVTAIMKALTETPDYQEEEPVEEPAESTKPKKSEYDTVNTKNRQVKIQGCHTLLSLALSMPSKMGENVRPSSIVAFLLHIANENGLNIVQDRSKRTWMSDFMVLNDERMPSGVKIGSLEAQNEFWKRTQDPDAIEEGETAATTTTDNLVFGNMTRLKIGNQARKRGAAQMAPTAALNAIDEVDEMAE